MARKKFSEREILETLWHQGYDLRCYRCKESLFSSTELKPKIEREHLTEIALGGADHPINCRYSCAPCHKRVTNGTNATTAGSSKQRIAKVRRLRGENKPKPKRKWPSRPMGKGREFEKRKMKNG